MASTQTSAHDAYGFPISGLSTAEQTHRADVETHNKLASKAWARIVPFHKPTAELTAAVAALPDRTSSVSSKLKLAIRDCVPHSLRSQLWLQLSGANDLRAQAAGDYYASAVKAAGVHALPLTQLEADLTAVSAPHPLLYSRRALEAVRRIVMAYGHRDPVVGYSPLLAGLILFMLAVLGVDSEQSVFWLLAALMERVLPAGYYVGNKGIHVEQRVFEALLPKKLPRAASQLMKLEVDLVTVTEPWFASLFTRTLPPETTVRVWDWLFAEGPKVLLRVALAVFKSNEVCLTNAMHGFQLVRTLQWRVQRMYQSISLSKVAFNGLGSLRTSSIAQTRALVERLIAAEFEEQDRRIEALFGVASSKAAKQRCFSAPALNVIIEADESSQSDVCYSSE